MRVEGVIAGPVGGDGMRAWRRQQRVIEGCGAVLKRRRAGRGIVDQKRNRSGGQPRSRDSAREGSGEQDGLAVDCERRRGGERAACDAEIQQDGCGADVVGL